MGFWIVPDAGTTWSKQYVEQSPMHTNTMLQSDVIAELKWKPRVDAAEAEQYISLLNGVTGIGNRLVVTPGVSPVDVKDKIESAFQRNASLEARDVTVAVDGPKVTLTGQVRSWHDLEQAEEVAWAAPGVREVENLLEVQI